MRLIPYNDHEGSIKVTIEIEGFISWKYVYNADESFNNSTKLKKEPVHELGIGENLNDEFHQWKILLANHDSIDRKVEITLVWFENGEEIGRWTPEEADKNGMVLVKAHAGKEVFGICYFSRGFK